MASLRAAGALPALRSLTVSLGDELLELPSARWRVSLTVDIGVPVTAASSVSVHLRGVSQHPRSMASTSGQNVFAPWPRS